MVLNGRRVEPLYFGCWHTPGHHFWRVTMRKVWGSHRETFALTPWAERVDGGLTPRRSAVQGTAALHHSDGWTALSIHDYTVDSRPGSHSTFLMPGMLTFVGMLSAAHHHFPTVVDRIGPIRLVEEDGRWC